MPDPRRPRRPASPADAVRDIRDGLSALTDRLEEVFGTGAVNKEGTFEIPMGSEKAQGVFGINVRMGLGGLTTQTFGNLKPGDDGPEVAETREPLVDLFEEDGAVVVTVELPGAQDADIHVAASEMSIRIETVGARRYATETELDSAVDPDSLVRSYQNGILELRLTRRTA